MSESKFEILTSTKSVVEKLRDFLDLEDIEKIEVYCSDFEGYRQKSYASPAFQIYILLLNKARSKKEKFIQVYNHISFSQQSLMDSINKKDTKKEVGKIDGFFFFKGKNGIPLEDSREMQDMVADYLAPIAQEAKKRYSIKKRTTSYSVYSSVENIEKKSFKNLSEIFDDFLSSSNDLQKDLGFIHSSLQNLKQKLIEKFNKIWKNENIADGDIGKIVSTSIDTAFETLINEISEIKKDNNILAIKMTIKFFIQAIPAIIDIASKGGVSLSWFNFIQSSLEYINDLSEFNSNKYLYSIMFPLYQLFTQKIAPIFTLIARTNIKNVIYIHTKEKTYFIDYSGVNIDTKDCSIFTQFNCAFAGEYIHKGNTCQSSSFSITHFQEENTEEKIKNFFSTLNPRINFLCSPYFTSYKLTQWLQESTTQVLDSNNKKIGANYFILTQCPIKLKAGVSEEIIKRLGYEIKDSINRTSQSPKLTQKPEKHNPVVDYSKYEIKINANDNQPFALSLSPFGFIPQSKYKDIKELSELEEKSYTASGAEAYLSATYKKPEAPQDIASFRYIQNFFQSPNKIDEYFQKDKELFEKQVGVFKDFFSSFSIEAKQIDMAKYYSCHIILMALMFQTLKENYEGIQYHTSTFSKAKNFFYSGECLEEYISIGKEKILVTPFHSYAYLKQISQTTYASIYLCYSKKKKETIDTDEPIFCIQEFAERIFEGASTSLESFYALHFDGKAPSTPQEKEREKELIFCYLLAIKSIISIFPFISFLSPYKNLNEKILKAMLGYPILLEAFYNQIARNFSLHTLQDKVAKKMQTLAEQEHAHFDWNEFAKDETINFALDNLQSFGDLLLNEKELQELIKEYKGNPVEQIRKKLFSSLKPYAISHIKSFSLDLLVAGIDKLWITEYEKQKKAFEMLLYTKFTDKNNAPLALEREEGVYYPIGINQTFLSFSFQNMILGGEFCTGGLGYLKSNFYLLQESTSGQPKNKNTQENPSIVRNYQLNILFSLLCLDEIRNREAGEREEDQKFFKQNHSEKEFINYILDLENEQDLALYESYGEGSGEVGGNGQGGAIKSYQVAMQYLGDIQKGVFDSDTNSNKPNPKKHREAIRALDNIGKNNIRGLYVGIRGKSKKETRPKLIGRLATTIIMKDGLWIG